MSYSIREASDLIICKEFHSMIKASKQNIFYSLMQDYKILYYQDNYGPIEYRKKWIINWNVIKYKYPELLDCFVDYFTDKGYYQPKITAIGIEKIKDFIYTREV